MARLMTFVMVTVGLMLLMNLAGIQTSAGYILSTLGINIGNIQNFNANNFYIVMVGAIVVLASVSGIRIGVFGAPSNTTFAAAGAALPLVVLIGDLISIVIQANATGLSWASYLVFLIIVPFVFGYMIALFDWARGID